MTVIGADAYNSTTLGVATGASSPLYQRTAYNALTAGLSSAVDIGQLVTNKTQLGVVSQITGANQNDYYSFNLQGTSMKMDMQNVTNTTGLRTQIYNSSGAIVADSNGTPAQVLAYTNLTTSAGLATPAGQYTAKVSYAPTAQTNLPQKYALELYSGSKFDASYQTTAVVQTSQSTFLPVDKTGTYATAGAQVYTRQDYNQINSTPATGVNIGWLSQNTSQLSVNSTVTTADNTDYYNFTFQKGSALKMAFNNTTNTAALHVQLMDSSGTTILADNQGTTAQKAAYAQMTSASGLSAQTGSYAVKVSYGTGADTSKNQFYNFQLSSGTSYSSSYLTNASAQTISNAILSGNYNGYSQAATTANAMASYLTNMGSGYSSGTNGSAPFSFTTTTGTTSTGTPIRLA